mmetsp:Transcript_26750/g.45631  ORF Transcript_26750/g.45631 Transcript_26750/m.45631 type:complete len:427 (-) Transcript_26750:175-1455(-)
MKKSSAIAVLLLGARARGYNIRGKAKRESRQNADRGNAVSSATFGTSLFSELCKEFPNDNVLVSPLSVYQAIALVKEGATDGSKCESELEGILGPPTAQENANSIQRRSRNKNDADAGVKFSMATSIWSDGLKETFKKRALDTQDAESFDLPSKFSEVDNWIEDKTDGMIKELLGNGDIDSTIVALLVNAVHFKGKWTNEFDKKKTADGDFQTFGGIKKARYMTDRRKMEVIPQAEALDYAKVLVLDYGKQKTPEFSAIFILPETTGPDALSNVITSLNSNPASELLKDVRSTDVLLKLPRYQLDFGPSSIKPSLKKMGMKTAFMQCNPKRLFLSQKCSKFDNMSDDPFLYVDDVLHGACMQMTEEGTKATAATAVIMRTRSIQRGPFEFILDRPFIAIIWHWPSETPVFIAKVQDPQFLFGDETI